MKAKKELFSRLSSVAKPYPCARRRGLFIFVSYLRLNRSMLRKQLGKYLD